MEEHKTDFQFMTENRKNTNVEEKQCNYLFKRGSMFKTS